MMSEKELQDSRYDVVSAIESDTKRMSLEEKQANAILAIARSLVYLSDCIRSLKGGV